MIFEGIAQRFVQRAAGTLAARLSELGSITVDQVKADGDEMTRAGLRYHMSAIGATGIAPVQALPSTAAQWMIYNPLSNPVTAFIDRLAIVNNSGTGGVQGNVLFMCIVPPKFAPSTIPTQSTANVTVNNANGVSAKSSSLIVVSAQTLQNAAAGNWIPIAQSVLTGADILGTELLDTGWDIRGKIALPPGCGLGLCVVGGVGATPLYAPSASWREYSSDME